MSRKDKKATKTNKQTKKHKQNETKKKAIVHHWLLYLFLVSRAIFSKFIKVQPMKSICFFFCSTLLPIKFCKNSHELIDLTDKKCK